MSHNIALPPCLALTFALCRWPRDADGLATIRCAAADVGDWPQFLSLVRRHRIAGLAYEGLMAAEATVPEPVHRALSDMAARVVRQNLCWAAEAVRLQNIFAAANIRAVFLKGGGLAMQAYGTLALKQSRDIDLFVAPAQRADAFAALTKAGYGLYHPAAQISGTQWRWLHTMGREVELRRPAGLPLELCWRLCDNDWLLQGFDPLAASKTVVLPSGETICTLNDTALFAYLCVHGASHGWGRLKWLADFHACFGRVPQDILATLYREAETVGAGPCAGQALLLCQRFFTMRLAKGLAADLSASFRVRYLTRIATAAMLRPSPHAWRADRPFYAGRLHLYYFLLGRRPRYLLRQVRLLASGKMDVFFFPLPAALHFLYPILRVPLWACRHVWAKTKRPHRTG